MKGKQLHIEKVSGTRCKWVITYSRAGKKYFDGIFHGDTPEEAKAEFLWAVRENRWVVSNVKVYPRDKINL